MKNFYFTYATVALMGGYIYWALGLPPVAGIVSGAALVLLVAFFKDKGDE